MSSHKAYGKRWFSSCFSNIGGYQIEKMVLLIPKTDHPDLSINLDPCPYVMCLINLDPSLQATFVLGRNIMQTSFLRMS